MEINNSIDKTVQQQSNKLAQVNLKPTPLPSLCIEDTASETTACPRSSRKLSSHLAEENLPRYRQNRHGLTVSTPISDSERSGSETSPTHSRSSSRSPSPGRSLSPVRSPAHSPKRSPAQKAFLAKFSVQILDVPTTTTLPLSVKVEKVPLKQQRSNEKEMHPTLPLSDIRCCPKLPKTNSFTSPESSFIEVEETGEENDSEGDEADLYVRRMTGQRILHERHKADGLPSLI